VRVKLVAAGLGAAFDESGGGEGTRGKLNSREIWRKSKAGSSDKMAGNLWGLSLGDPATIGFRSGSVEITRMRCTLSALKANPSYLLTVRL
jgi:hypothetical protein